ncbi:MAG: response regulator [Candidatus Anammoxibacter sp.]
MVNILVIDDEEGIRESFKMALEPENRVVTTSSGEEGIAKAAINQPDIIFLDLKMPGMGGIEALIQLQAISARIPTLIMTGFYEEHMLRLEKVRANGCLFEICHKPMDSKQIKLKVIEYRNRLNLKKGITGENIVIKENKACEIQNDEKHVFKLYIAGQPSEYNEIIESIRNMFDNHLQYYELEVINVVRNPELAERDNIIATPTIVKGNGSEPLMVIGDMSNGESVLSSLGLIENAEVSEV